MAIDPERVESVILVPRRTYFRKYYLAQNTEGAAAFARSKNSETPNTCNNFPGSTLMSPKNTYFAESEKREPLNQTQRTMHERARQRRRYIPEDYSNSRCILPRHIRVQTTTEFRIFFNLRDHTLDYGQFAGYHGGGFQVTPL